MPRLQLKDELWSRLKMIFFVCGIYETKNLRMTVEGILYKLRTGCPWRDLPSFLVTGTAFIDALIDAHCKEN